MRFTSVSILALVSVVMAQEMAGMPMGDTAPAPAAMPAGDSMPMPAGESMPMPAAQPMPMASGDKPAGDKPAGDDKPAGEKPTNGTAPATMPAGESTPMPAGDKPAGDKPAGDKPAGDMPAAMPAGEPMSMPSGGSNATGEGMPMPSGDKPAGDKPAGDKPAGDKPAGEKPAGDKPAGDMPAAMPAGEPMPMPSGGSNATGGGMPMPMPKEGGKPAGKGDGGMQGMPGMDMGGMMMGGMMGGMDGMMKGGNSLKSQCKKINRLQQFVTYAGNTTLVSVFVSNETKLAAIAQQVDMANTKLQALQSNTSLMNDCTSSGIFAVETEKNNCYQMVSLQRLNKFVMNDTKTAKFNDTAKVDKLKALSMEKMGDLNMLTSNDTLLQFCSNEKSVQNCKRTNRLQRMENFAKNETALMMMFNDTEKIQQFQARAQKALPKLKALQDNSTLMGVCSKLPANSSGFINNAQKAGNDKPSGAVRVTVSIVAVFTAALFIL